MSLTGVSRGNVSVIGWVEVGSSCGGCDLVMFVFSARFFSSSIEMFSAAARWMS